MPAFGVFYPSYVTYLLNVFNYQEMYWVKPRKEKYALFLYPSLRNVFVFSKMLRDSAFNFLSSMMYVSFMSPSLVFMCRPHVCSAVHPLAQWLLVALLVMCTL